MRSARWVIVGTMAVAVLCAAARAEEASVLMQEGVYEQDVAGDLGKAMAAYRKIIANAEGERRYVAEAHFRLAQCLLAKGEKAGAQEHFRAILERYGDQEKLAAAAGAELEKLSPPPPRVAKATLGPVIELTVNDESAAKDMYVDFDSGRLLTLPAGVNKMDAEEFTHWIRESGVDAVGQTRTRVRGMIEFGMFVQPVASDLWNSATAESIPTEGQLPGGQPARWAAMPGTGKLPVTYIFSTREGGRGILQIVGFADNPSGVRVRYRMVQQGPAAPAGQWTFRPVVEQTVEDRQFVDFDSGKVLETSKEEPGPGMGLMVQRARETGADAFFFVGTGTDEQRWRMVSCDLAFSPPLDRSDEWSELTADALAERASGLGPGKSAMRVLGDPSETMLIRTREGGLGILQIVGESPKAVRVRYKMVRNTDAQPNRQDAVNMLGMMATMFASLRDALDRGDAEAGLDILATFLPQLRSLREDLKGTPAYGPVGAAIEQLGLAEKALREGNVDQAKSIIHAFDFSGPQLADLVKAASKGQGSGNGAAPGGNS